MGGGLGAGGQFGALQAGGGCSLAGSWDPRAPAGLLSHRQSRGRRCSTRHPSCHQSWVSHPIPMPWDGAVPWGVRLGCWGDLGRSRTPRAQSCPSCADQEPQLCRALFDYAPELPDELPLRQGDVIQVLSKVRGRGDGSDPKAGPGADACPARRRRRPRAGGMGSAGTAEGSSPATSWSSCRLRCPR